MLKKVPLRVRHEDPLSWHSNEYVPNETQSTPLKGEARLV